MHEHNDPLWDPRLPGDAQLNRLESLLAPSSAGARGLGQRMPRIPSPAPLRRHWPLALAASLLLCAVAAYLLHGLRLHWDEGRAWTLSSELQGSGQIAPGDVLATSAAETVELSVARIGRVVLSPMSRLSLLGTGPSRHRVRLDHGHLRARIWAPPGYFGVHSGTAEIIDLGCDFDLWVETDHSGRVAVRSGWIVYRVGGHERLVPAGHVLEFDARRPGTPLREDAPPAVRELVREMDALLAAASLDSLRLNALSVELAGTARDAEAFTLLSLLSQRPGLAAGPLYPRLATALKVPVDDPVHRQSWIAGEQAPRNTWWKLLPTQPKQWWRNWRDLFDR